MNILLAHKKALMTAVLLALYLRFLLTPTAWLFYELYHATGVEFIYWGYRFFRALGYYFGIWPYQSLACVLLAAGLFGMAIWRGSRAAAVPGN